MVIINKLRNLKTLNRKDKSVGFIVNQALTHSLFGAGPAWTHVRASVGGITDAYGTWQLAKSGELRYYGARRVSNLCTTSEAFTTGWSVGVNTTLSSVTGVTSARTGRESIKRLDRITSINSMIALSSQTYRPGKHTFQVALATLNGTDTVKVRIERSSDSALVAQIDVVPPAWDGSGDMPTYAVTGDITDGTTHRVLIYQTNAAISTVFVDGAMMVYTQGRTDVVDEYVSIGVLSAPWHGANVDGVKYFNTYSGNTADGNGLVTFAAGTAIPATTTLGALQEPGSTNGQYDSRDITTANWAKTAVTAAGTMISSEVLGYNSLRKMEEDNTINSHRIGQDWRGGAITDNRRMVVSCYALPAERNVVRIGFINKAGTVNLAYYDLTTNAVTNLTGGAEVEAFMYTVGDLKRLVLIGSAGVGAGVPQSLFGLAATAGTASYQGVTGSGAYFGALQFEQASVPTQYKGDTAAAAVTTTISDNLYHPHDLPSTQWEIGCDFTPMYNQFSNNKTSWSYLWYARTDVNNRHGLALRPGTYGGFTDSGSDDWVYDLYNADNEFSWDGIDLTGQEENAGPFTTKRAIVQMHSSAVLGASNLAGKIGSSTMYNALAATKSVNTTPTCAYMRIGHNSETLGSTTINHSFCIKNYYIKPRPTANIVSNKPPAAFMLNGWLPTYLANFRDRSYSANAARIVSPVAGSIRASNATQYNENGKIVWAPHNLITRSNDWTTGWTLVDSTPTVSSVLMPSGDPMTLITTGTLGTANVNIPITSNPVATTPLNFQVKLKRGNHDWVRIVIYQGASSSNQVRLWVNLATQSKGTFDAFGTVTGITSTVEDLGDGISLVSITGSLATNDPVALIAPADANNSATRPNNAQFYVGEAQGELADIDSPKRHVKTAGAAVYEVRHNYDPLTLEPAGILVESTRTNNVSTSEAVGGFAADNTLAPTLMLGRSARRLTGHVFTGAKFTATSSFLPTGATLHTVSGYVRYVDHQFIQLATTINASTADDYVNFDLINGTITQQGATAVGEIEATAEVGVYRISMTWTTTAVPSSGAAVVIYFQDSGTALRGGSSSSEGSFDFMGLQHEVGDKMTSLMPTISAAATRSGDDTKTLLGKWLVSSRGTVVAKVRLPRRTSTTETLFNIGDLGFNERIQMRGAGSTYNTVFTDGGVVRATAPVGPSTVKGVVTAALRYVVGTQVHVVDGVVGGTTGNVANITANATYLHFGKLATTSESLNGHIEFVAYYNDNSASNAQLQALTALDL